MMQLQPTIPKYLQNSRREIIEKKQILHKLNYMINSHKMQHTRLLISSNELFGNKIHF